MEEIMHNQRSFVNSIFTLLLVMGMFLSLGTPQSVIAENGNQPTLSSGQQDKPELADETLLLEPPPIFQENSEAAARQEDQNVDSTPQFNPSTETDSDVSADLMSSIFILDDFNRANGPIGSNWTVRNGYCNTFINTAVCGGMGLATFNGAPGDGNAAEADITVMGSSLQYTGLVLNYGAGVNNLFIKVQQGAPNAGQFTNAACYLGNNGSSFGLGFFALTSPFSTAHMKVTRFGSTVTIVFSNIDYGAKPNQIYTCTGAPPPEGTGIGILGYDGIARVDNFGIPRVVDTILWDQPLSSFNQNSYVDQDFPDFPTNSSYLADDFISDNTWSINSIFIPGSGWNGFDTLMDATALNWKIYADNGGVPAGDPSGGGSPPVWSLTLSPANPQVTISTGSDGYPSDTSLRLTTPISLPPGHYWLIFYPTMTYSSSGQYGRQPADMNNGYVGQFINPGGAFGYGTVWQNWTVINPDQHDIAFRLEGKVSDGEWKSINPINGAGRSRPAAAAVGEKLYVVGGEIPAGRANTVEEYDRSTGIWTTQAGLMPTPASNICAAVIGTDIYIPGGYDLIGTYLNTLQVYHTTTDTWTTVTTDPLPTGAIGPGCAALSGKVYVFGGINGGGYLSSAYVYNPAAAAGSRWTTLPSMTYPRAYLAGAAVNGKIYAIGGLTSSPDLAYVEAFNPADGSWHTVSSLNNARGGPGAFSLGNYLVVCGGGWVNYYNTCERYDTNQGYSGAWTYMSSMINGRRTFAYANLGPALYAVAGYKGTYLTSAERWSIETFLPAITKYPFTTLGFDSQFNGSASGWNVIAGDWYQSANDIFTEGTDGLWSSVAYNTSFSNFDYQARMIRYGSDTYSNQLIIRGTPTPLDPSRQWYSEYIFQYTRNGYYSVWKVVAGGGAIPLQGWTVSPAINTGDAWNILRVIASDSNLDYYINGTLVWSGNDTSLTSGRVGIGMYRPSPGAGDLLRVDWATLWTNSSFHVTDVVSQEQQLLNDAANLMGGGEVNKAP
jgi:N-acetylneuraminic acid mutarotase